MSGDDVVEREAKRIREAYGHYVEEGAHDGRWTEENPGYRALLREREERLVDVLQATLGLPVTAPRVLDVGCGSGHFLAWLRSRGAGSERAVGLDLVEEGIVRGQGLYPELDLRVSEGGPLPFESGEFDLVVLFTVFSSILSEPMAEQLAGEVDRVLRPRGGILWYDMRYPNPWNPNIRPVGRRDLRDRFPGYDLHLRSVTLLPPLARRLGAATPVLYPILAAVPPLRSHLLGMLRKPA